MSELKDRLENDVWPVSVKVSDFTTAVHILVGVRDRSSFQCDDESCYFIVTRGVII